MSLAVVFAWQSRDLFAACKGEPADKKGITARNFVLKTKGSRKEMATSARAYASSNRDTFFERNYPRAASVFVSSISSVPM
ncbi:MAG TPA: hypothetical protein VGQ12_08750 [Candidatus Angelobacter sp.]|jgi:hypothetical protein|nr:hypothetical protein [Candidatus Angelobacter sp.]